MITPVDIENKRFARQRINGYNVDEVDDFLDDISVHYAKKTRELAEANQRVKELEESMEKYKTIETTLQNTLVMAQTTADEVKKVAKDKADQIINDAKSQAKNEAETLNQQIVYRRKALDDLRKQSDIYKAKMESLLISQLELIKDINKDDDI